MFPRINYFFRTIFKKPFKVAIVTYYYPEGNKLDNGVAIHTYYLSRELSKLGCEVHIFAKGDKSYKKTEYIGEGKIIVHRIDTKINFEPKDAVVKKRMAYFLFDNKVINEITKENSKEKFNIIHTHGWLTAGAFIAKNFNDLKWVHTFHALEKNRIKFMTEEEKKYFQIAKWFESTIKYADALISVSKKLKIEVMQNYPVKDEEVFYIPNGVDLELFNSENHPPSENKICYIGRFSLEKGIDFVSKIAENVLKKDDKLKFVVVAKETKNISSLEKIKEEFLRIEKEYPERFKWHRENLSREDISKLIKECSILIQPSRYEAFGLTVLEAMACGTAVITSNQGALPEVVENAGKTLPLKTKNFVREIINLSNNYRLRERYVRRGILKSKEYDWKNISEKTLKLYKKIDEGKYFKS